MICHLPSPRRDLRWKRRALRCSVWGAVLLLTPTVCHRINAQTTTLPPSPSLPSGGYGHDRKDDDDWFGSKEIQDKLQRTRERERQKRIVDSTKHLLELAQQYRQSVQEHGVPTAEDQKLLVQIEKLARDVKDRMRGM